MWFIGNQMVSLQVNFVLFLFVNLFYWYNFRGKVDRQDVYQAPYVWVQFNNLQSNVLVHVICRLYAKNIYFDKKYLGLTRFKLFRNWNKSSIRQNDAS